MNIEEHYNNYDESNRMLSSKARRIEFMTTSEILSENITGQDRILELGAGGGIYTEYLSRSGCNILSTDLVDEYVELIKKRTKDSENVRVRQMDARNLSSEIEEDFTRIFCMGPFYHLDLEDRTILLQSCFKKTHSGGKLFLSYINKAFAHGLYLKYRMNFNKSDYEHFKSNKFNQLTHIDKFMGFTYYSTPEQVETELIQAGYTIKDHIGVDGYYHLISESIETMSDEQFLNFYSYHKSICREKSTLGMSSHGLVVCEK